MFFTTLIPVYKTQFLEDLIACLNAQTCKEFQVIFSDDSPTQDAAQILQELTEESNLSFHYRIVSGPRLGPASNCHHLLTEWAHSTPYIHYLLDDDLISPDFYAQHKQAHGSTLAPPLVISARNIVNERKQIQKDAPLPIGIKAGGAAMPISFAACIAATLPNCDNWLGELSCATMQGDFIAQHIQGQLARLPYYGLNDLGLFLEILHHATGAFIPQTLGSFRINRWQCSRDVHSDVFRKSNIAWLALALDAYHLGVLTEEQTRECLAHVSQAINKLLPANPNLATTLNALTRKDSLAQLYQRFQTLWLHELQQSPDYRHATSPVLQGQIALAPFL